MHLKSASAYCQSHKATFLNIYKSKLHKKLIWYYCILLNYKVYIIDASDWIIFALNIGYFLPHFLLTVGFTCWLTHGKDIWGSTVNCGFGENDFAGLDSGLSEVSFIPMVVLLHLLFAISN